MEAVLTKTNGVDYVALLNESFHQIKTPEPERMKDKPIYIGTEIVYQMINDGSNLYFLI